MLLRCTTHDQSVDEKNLRTWLRNELGDTDEEIISRYFWENHRGSGVPYVIALEALVRETAENGVEFTRKLLDAAKLPLEQRQAATDLRAWWVPRVAKAVAIVSRYKGEDREKAAKEEYDSLIRDLIATVRQMFPDKHRATVKGAVVAAIVHENGSYSFEPHKLVAALFQPDPLAANARASWYAEPA